MEEIQTCSIDERVQDTASAVSTLGQKFADGYSSLARAVIDARESLSIGLYASLMRESFGDFVSLLAFACEHPSRRKRVSMDVNKMVEIWLPLVVKLAVAHDIDEKDAASSALDEHLKPIVAAPVSEIREFYRKLTKRMKEDKSVPWAVWRLFEYWGENVLDKVEKEEVEGIKKEIALRIVERSFNEIPQQDWVDSMVGALQWRSPEKLAEIERSLDEGARPRVRGKESCLFLQVGESEVML